MFLVDVGVGASMMAHLHGNMRRYNEAEWDCMDLLRFEYSIRHIFFDWKVHMQERAS